MTDGPRYTDQPSTPITKPEVTVNADERNPMSTADILEELHHIRRNLETDEAGVDDPDAAHERVEELIHQVEIRGVTS